MRANRGEPLRHAVVLASDDVHDGQRQEALRDFLQSGIENLIDLAPQDLGGQGSGAAPKGGEQDAQRKPQSDVEAPSWRHGLPSR